MTEFKRLLLGFEMANCWWCNRDIVPYPHAIAMNKKICPGCVWDQARQFEVSWADCCDWMRDDKRI